MVCWPGAVTSLMDTRQSRDVLYHSMHAANCNIIRTDMHAASRLYREYLLNYICTMMSPLILWHDGSLSLSLSFVQLVKQTSACML